MKNRTLTLKSGCLVDATKTGRSSFWHGLCLLAASFNTSLWVYSKEFQRALELGHIPCVTLPWYVGVHFMLLSLPYQVKTLCILHFMQSTFFYLERFLKKLADDQCSSLSKSSIYHIKHNTPFCHGSGLTIKLTFKPNHTMVFFVTFVIKGCEHPREIVIEHSTPISGVSWASYGSPLSINTT